jgi:hypothetical protein
MKAPKYVVSEAYREAWRQAKAKGLVGTSAKRFVKRIVAQEVSLWLRNSMNGAKHL